MMRKKIDFLGQLGLTNADQMSLSLNQLMQRLSGTQRGDL